MAKIDKVLGSISPLYGAVSGQGLFGPLRSISPIMMAIDATKSKKKGTTVSEEEVEETGMKRGGKVKMTPAQAVHKHERNMHKGKPLTKFAKGGSASKRADGCATKGKTKGRFV